jgi:phage terminase large subunit-like protein
MVERACNTSRPSPFDPVRKKFYEWFRGKAGRHYFVHVDHSVSQDNTGMAMVHREPTGSIVVDWMWAEMVPEGRKISFAAIREYIYELRSHGFLIEQVTFDQFMSENTPSSGREELPHG